MKIIEEKLLVKSLDGISIPAVFCVSNGESRRALLFLHGITTQKDEYGDFFADLARAFAAQGIASLRIDFRGHGESAVPQREFSVASQICDTLAAVRWLSGRTACETVSLLGCSFGCPPAVFSSQILKDVVDKIVLVCPVLDYKRTFLRPETPWAKKEFSASSRKEWLKRGFLTINGSLTADAKLLCELGSLEPFETLKRAKTRCLLIHGTADSMVPFAVAKAIVEQRPSTEHLFIENMDHGYGDADDESGVNRKSKRNFATIRDSIARFLIAP